MHLYKRFMMKHNPEFFSLTQEEQDNYKIKEKENLRFPFQQFLFKELLGIELKSESDEDNHILSEEDIFKLNMHSCFLNGIGKNFFFLNECLPDNKNILSYKTLFDYDFDYHNTQEQYMIEDKYSKKTKADPYRIRIYGNWARCHLKEHENEMSFYYLIISSVYSYVYQAIIERADDYIKTLIPYEYIRNKDHGKREKGGSLLSIGIDANGMEGQLDELKSRYYSYLTVLYRKLQDLFFENKLGKVWCIDQSEKNDPTKYYYFSDEEVMKNISFTNWQEDTEKYITDDISLLNEHIDKHFLDLKVFLDEQHKDIIENFDPSIVKFKKKTKTVIADDALKNL